MGRVGLCLGAVPAGRGCLDSGCNAGSSGSPLQSKSIGVRKLTGNQTLSLLSVPEKAKSGEQRLLGDHRKR